MKNQLKFLVLILIVFQGCKKVSEKITNKKDSVSTNIENNKSYINETGMTVQTRFQLPDGFERKPVDENSFAAYLRNLP